MIIKASALENTINTTYLQSLLEVKANAHNTLLTNFDTVREEDFDLQNEAFIKSVSRVSDVLNYDNIMIKTPTRTLYILVDDDHFVAKFMDEQEKEFVPLLVGVPNAEQDDFEQEFAEQVIAYIKEHFAS